MGQRIDKHTEIPDMLNRAACRETETNKLLRRMHGTWGRKTVLFKRRQEISESVQE